MRIEPGKLLFFGNQLFQRIAGAVAEILSPTKISIQHASPENRIAHSIEGKVEYTLKNKIQHSDE